MTTWTSEDREACMVDLRNQNRMLQNELVKTQTQLVMAMAELEAIRNQLISLTNSKH